MRCPTLAFLLFCLFGSLSLGAQPYNPCADFERLMGEALAELEKPNFDADLILRKLRSARVLGRDCDPKKAARVEERFSALYNRLEQQKQDAVRAKERALRAEAELLELKRLYANNSATLTTAQYDPTLALRMAEFNRLQHSGERILVETFHDILGREQNAFYRQRLQGHRDQVAALEFAPDGRFIASASHDYTARIWDTEGQEVAEMRHSSKVNAIAFNRTSDRVVTGTYDGIVHLWDLQGREIRQWKAHEREVSALKFTSDGQQLLSGSKSGLLRRWDLQGQQLGEYRHGGRVYCLAIAPGDSVVYSGGSDHLVRKWEHGQAVDSFYHRGIVYAIDIDRTGRYLLTGTSDHMAWLWDLQARPKVIAQEAAENDSLFSSSILPAIRLPSEKKRIALEGHTNVVFAVRFSPDGRRLLTGSADQTVRVWDRYGSLQKLFKGHNESLFSLAVSATGEAFASGSHDGDIKIWSIDQDFLLRQFEGLSTYQDAPYSMAVSPDQSKILCASRNLVYLWDEQGRQINFFGGNRPALIKVLAFHPDGNSFFAAGTDSLVLRYALHGELLATYPAGPAGVQALAVSPDGQWLAAGRSDQVTLVWSLTSGSSAPVRVIDSYPGQVRALDYAPHDNLLLVAMNDFNSTSREYQPRLLVLNEAGELAWRPIEPGHDSLQTAIFAPDGESLLVGMSNNVAEWWGRDRRLKRIFRGHRGAVLSVAFSADGQQVLTGSMDRSVRLWNLQGQVVQTFSDNRGPVIRAYFGREGKTVISGSQDNTVRIWTLWPAYLDRHVASFSLPELVMSGLDLNEKELRQIEDQLDFEGLGTLAEYYREGGQWSRARRLIRKRIELKDKAPDRIALFQVEQQMGVADFSETFLGGDEEQLTEVFNFFRREGQRLAAYPQRAAALDRATRIGEVLLKKSDNLRFVRTLSVTYNSLSWYLLLTRDFSGSERAVRRGIQLDPTNRYLYTNLAPALLFQGKYQAAEKIYLEKMDETYMPWRNLNTYREVFLKDFSVLETEGAIPRRHRDRYERIRNMLAEGSTKQLYQRSKEK